jgi:hypothetical protein
MAGDGRACPERVSGTGFTGSALENRITKRDIKLVTPTNNVKNANTVPIPMKASSRPIAVKSGVMAVPLVTASIYQFLFR